MTFNVMSPYGNKNSKFYKELIPLNSMEINKSFSEKYKDFQEKYEVCGNLLDGLKKEQFLGNFESYARLVGNLRDKLEVFYDDLQGYDMNFTYYNAASKISDFSNMDQHRKDYFLTEKKLKADFKGFCFELGLVQRMMEPYEYIRNNPLAKIPMKEKKETQYKNLVVPDCVPNKN